MVIWVRVESTGYCLTQSWVTDSAEEKTLIFQLYLKRYMERTNLQLHLTAPPPRSTTFGEIRQNEMSHESYLTQIWLILTQMSWVRVESGWEIWDLSWVRVESTNKISVVSRVRVESPRLSHESESSQPEKFESSTTLPATTPSVWLVKPDSPGPQTCRSWQNRQTALHAWSRLRRGQRVTSGTQLLISVSYRLITQSVNQALNVPRSHEGNWANFILCFHIVFHIHFIT